MDTTQLETLRQLEVTIKKCEGIALEARWESGCYLNSLKKGKQLPRGLRAECAEALGVSESELTARMKFATKYPSAEELTNAVSKFNSWHRLVREGLTDKPRSKVAAQSAVTKAAKLVAAFTDIDPIELTPELLKQLRETIHRHEQSLETLALKEAV